MTENRIKRIQDKHSWMLEREVRLLLTAAYIDAHQHEFEIDRFMDHAVDRINETPRKQLEELLYGFE